MEEEEGPRPFQKAAACCAVCRAEAAKYKCPRCFVQTCSLACVKRHKEDSQCRWVGRPRLGALLLGQGRRPRGPCNVCLSRLSGVRRHVEGAHAAGAPVRRQ